MNLPPPKFKIGDTVTVNLPGAYCHGVRAIIIGVKFEGSTWVYYIHLEPAVYPHGVPIMEEFLR